MPEIKISAKNLGALAIPDACPRCFWIKNNLKSLPWQIFPGIFSSIDAYTKKVVHHVFDMTGKPPAWIPEISEANNYLKAMHWSKFLRKDEDTGITVSGMVDDLFECEDLSRIIVDYKTAKFTKNQDKLLPMYDAQLNFYAWIEEGFGNTVRAELPLIYCEPITDPGEKSADNSGFYMPFSAKAMIIQKDVQVVRDLLDRAADIVFGSIPAVNESCKDCMALESIKAA